MEELKNKIICGGVGAMSSLAGIVSLSRCSGSACTSCFGCLASGAGIILLAVINKSKIGKENQNGMA
ncbi:MAG: hypothetical protein M0Z89_02725 [Nitrospiraceae bacterium]|nr:hypothetical protein [Nitrospiraceae bacterium]